MKKTILIVDDDPGAQRRLRAALEARNYRTLSSENGVAGFQLALRERPDLILMDVHLPDISGLEIADWIKTDEKLKETPVIGLASNQLRAAEQRVLSRGCDGFLGKPLTMDKVIEAVEDLAGAA